MKKLIFPLFFLLPLFASAGKTNVDSLVNVLNIRGLSVKEQADICLKLCESYRHNDLKEFAKYTEKGLQMAEKENFKTMMADFYRYKALGYEFSWGKTDSAVMYYEKGLELAVETKYEACEAEIYGGLGTIHIYNSQYKDDKIALKYFLRSLQLYEKLGDKKNISLALNRMGTYHRLFGSFDRAYHYAQKAKTLAEEIDYDFGKMSAYYNLGDLDYESDESVEYNRKALKIARDLGDKAAEVCALQGLAYDYCLGKGACDKGEKYALECLQVAEEYGESRSIICAWTVLSYVYLYQQRYDECKAMVLNAWEADSLNVQLSTLTNLAAAYLYSGEIDKAYSFFERYVHLTGEATEKQLQRSIAEMETKYETEKKEMRIAVLEEERKLYIGMGVVVVAALLLGMGLLFYRHRLVRQKRSMAEQQIKQLEQEKELIAVRSALNAEKAEREIIARDLHDGVSAMLSVVKNNMNMMRSYSIKKDPDTDYFNKALDGLDKSITELRRVAHHIMPAVLIEKGLSAALNDFYRSIPEAEFHSSESERRFDPEKELVLYRCAYELMNNSLRHAGASKIDVYLNMDERTVYLSVVDDGCGFDVHTASTGMGINNMHIRLSAFGGRMDIFSEPGKGTEVNVELDI